MSSYSPYMGYALKGVLQSPADRLQGTIKDAGGGQSQAILSARAALSSRVGGANSSGSMKVAKQATSTRSTTGGPAPTVPPPTPAPTPTVPPPTPVGPAASAGKDEYGREYGHYESNPMLTWVMGSDKKWALGYSADALKNPEKYGLQFKPVPTINDRRAALIEGNLEYQKAASDTQLDQERKIAEINGLLAGIGARDPRTGLTQYEAFQALKSEEAARQRSQVLSGLASRGLGRSGASRIARNDIATALMAQLDEASRQFGSRARDRLSTDLQDTQLAYQRQLQSLYDAAFAQAQSAEPTELGTVDIPGYEPPKPTVPSPTPGDEVRGSIPRPTPPVTDKFGNEMTAGEQALVKAFTGKRARSLSLQAVRHIRENGYTSAYANKMIAQFHTAAGKKAIRQLLAKLKATAAKRPAKAI